MSPSLVFIILLSLYIIDIANCNSCVIYSSERECNLQTRCLWDDALTKCVCGSIIPQDVVIIMDSSGSVQAAGWEIQKTFVHDLISTAIPISSPIGIIQFASNAWIRYQLTDSQNRTTILDTVSNLIYTRGWTYMKDAVQEAIHLFETQSENPQRRLVLITDGNPMPVSQTPCDLITDLNALGVDIMIIGVGASWSRERIDCLVKREQDIIEVEGFTNDAFEILRNETDEFLCRDVSFLLTEIKPHSGSINAHPVPFIEFYNNVKDMDLSLYRFTLSGTFNGNIQSTDIFRSIYGTNWPYGTYLVVFDNINDIDSDSTWCKDCICQLLAPSNQLCNESIYISMRGSYQTSFVDDWNIVVYDSTDTITRLVMNITHGMGANDWITIDEGYTYELLDITSCLPIDGSCWKQSCTIYGTAGSSPIDCDQVCLDQNCQIGGDYNATCNATGLCQCTKDICYNTHALPSCNCVFPPVNCSIVLNSNTGGTAIPSGDASWSKPSGVDWTHTHYILWYELRWYTFQNDEHEEVIRATPLNQRALTLFNMEYRDQTVWKQEVRTVIDFGDNPNSIAFDPEIRTSEWSVCQLLTMAPTTSPTPAPTLGLPPIDSCNVSIRAGAGIQFMTVDVEWSAADISASDTFNRNQFDDKYKLYFTETNVFVVGTDDLSGWTAKVESTSYAETLNTQYNATELSNGVLEVKVSVVVHAVNDATADLDEVDPAFDVLMYQQATVCEWYTLSPTLHPSIVPSLSPSNKPTKEPTFTPTVAPTYAWWVIEECVIEITLNGWIMHWVESDPSITDNLPNRRRIYVMMDDAELFIINPNQFSPQNIVKRITITANTEIKLIAQHVIIGNDATLAFSPNTAICDIESLAPTLSPTQNPTTIDHVPVSITPTLTPTIAPTASPTYYLPIEWCNVLLLSDNAYKITFKVAEYDTDGTTPRFSSVKYVIAYGAPASSHSIIPNSEETEITEVIFTPHDISISYESTAFNMTTKSRSSGYMFADWTECNVFSKTPTANPSEVPTEIPTSSPTHADVAVFVYSDDESICEGEERCACAVDKDNYNCIGSDYPHLPQIEETQLLFLPSNGELVNVLSIGRYPNNLAYEVYIEWQFVYLNDTNGFNWRQRIRPIVGTTTILSEEYLGNIVFAEFTAIGNDNDIMNPQYYRFEIVSCRVITGNNNVGCDAIYPYWAYVVWVPSQAVQAILIGGGDPIPDWIFYLLLGGSVTAVLVAYLLFVFFKNRNLKNNVAAQNESIAILTGIAPTTNIMQDSD